MQNVKSKSLSAFEGTALPVPQQLVVKGGTDTTTIIVEDTLLGKP